MKEIISGRFKRLDIFISRILKDFRAGDIHSFRLEIKKLRSFLRLINSGKETEDQLKIPRELKRMYKISGLGRNIRIHKKSVKKFNHRKNDLYIVKYLISLDMRETELENHLIRFIKHLKPLRKDYQRIIDRLPNQFGKVQKEKYVLYLTGKIRDIQFKISDSDIRMHQYRKLLKDFLYLKPYVKGETKFIGQYHCICVDNLKRISDKLGDFHDISIGIRYLDDQDLQASNNSGFYILNELKAGFQKNQNVIRNELLPESGIMRKI